MNSNYSYYACHQCINVDGIKHPASIIQIDNATNIASLYGPFDYNERAFIEWLGGTIILCASDSSPLVLGQTIKSYIDKSVNRKHHIDIQAETYAWHTPILDILHPIETPLIHLYKRNKR